MATLAIRLPVEMSPLDECTRGDRLDELVQLLGDCGAPAAEMATDLSRPDPDTPEHPAEADALDVVAEALVRLGRARRRGAPASPAAPGTHGGSSG